MKTRKELQNEYKQMKPRMGIFAIRNITSGRIYVARATNLDLIWNAERFKLDSGGHPNRELQQDWNACGSDNFNFEVLYELKPSDDPAVDARSELLALEALTIEDLQPFGEKGYNRKPEIRSA
ncbi:MAG: GIY-YIG nuclease family protein [Bacteroidota bacterium]|nr:GIY-YIG nuclease family protein [Bacteroidota bacterium]MDP4234647.1 GIY-YIG nuclease family protein [Bacteroidota bacterium]MDP4243812.1 GIY-YIG nuclease family protein [Bacteroidota bacterium]MDP4288597.1 GIY-YIG nuclease family protein [Bacteroidota bacterium]